VKERLTEIIRQAIFQLHRQAMGTAVMPSPRGSVFSPAYNTTPAKERSSASLFLNHFRCYSAFCSLENPRFAYRESGDACAYGFISKILSVAFIVIFILQLLYAQGFKCVIFITWTWFSCINQV
jgi:hypothetical protein